MLKRHDLISEIEDCRDSENGLFVVSLTLSHLVRGPVPTSGLVGYPML